jgi:hypothetical protein
MASGGGRRRRSKAKPRARAAGKAKKRTKYLSLSELLVKAHAQVRASPRSPWEDEEAAAAAEVKPEEDACGDDHHHDHEASTLFEAVPAPSLSDILGPSPPESPDGAGSGSGALPGAEEEDLLSRRALRGRARARWVYCTGGPSPPPATATATATASPCSSAASTGASPRSLLLKLDYDEILAAWAGCGPLYIGAAVSPRPVLADAEVAVGRAERVRRYREKRRRRRLFFARRVRYEVRRLNAVKRPRFKVTTKDHIFFSLPSVWDLPIDLMINASPPY